MSAPERGFNFGLASLLLAVPLIAAYMGEPYYLTLATRIAILSIAAVGLNFALGLGGLVSFGHAAYFGLGGYAAGILANHALKGQAILDWPFELGGTTFMPTIWLVAVFAAGLAAFLIGLLSLRTTGVYFIMITLAFAQMLYYFAVSWPAYGGEDGLPVYVRNSFPGLNTLDPVQFFLISYAVLLIALALFSLLRNSNFGVALRASRQNPGRVASLGIEVFRLRLAAFVLSGAITGLAGALYADLNRFVSPQMLSWHMSGEIMVFIILGGAGRLFGPVAGAVLYIILEQSLGEVSDYWQIFLGLLLLCVVLYARGGLIGAVLDRRLG
ncbi:MAG: branched-chain amino acid ABC transporter permease [Albidovulum sp.]|nr:branched-chain amino acid ABC transporter permease [Albidovulum sp.]MDE0307589.1 branched-chain amino acid ABC transporter permease [Albidovulum sp.]MDE0533057.1 branched-chain amino acid ABC transporter permease [Albidovulum sp.]